MTGRIRFFMIIASMMLTTSEHALETKYDSGNLPTLMPEAQHKTASKRIIHHFEQSHYREFKLNDAFSTKIFSSYLKTLDFNRLFFTQQEVNVLSKWRLEFDDQLRSGNTSAAYNIFNVSLQNHFERYQYALSLLDSEITFNIDEVMLIDRSDDVWAKDEAELNELWRLRVKNDALNLKLAGKEWADIQATLKKRYNNVLKHLIQTKSEDVFQVYMNAFFREVDPHTSYLSPRTAERFQSEMHLSLEGIGAVLQIEDDFTVIRSLVSGGPASNSKKLSPGDRIIGVAQDDNPVVNIIGWRLDDVIQLIKGPKASKVRLEILPKGTDSKSYKVMIVRDKIRLKERAVKSEVLKNSVGIISVPSFYVGLAEDTKKEISKLNRNRVTGIVIDLRNNGGGALNEASALTGLFIKSGPVVQVRYSNGRVKINSDSDNAIYYDGPLTVLINRYSASASEIFAAALQDYGRAIILGEQSFGKGTVQQHSSLKYIYDLFDKPLGYIQYTIQKFYRINGDSTQNRGVVPDIAFPTAVNPDETGESIAKNALPWDNIDPVVYNKVDTTKTLVVALDRIHKSRIKKDVEFGFIREDIAEYKLRKEDKKISLNEKSRLATREEADAKRLARLNSRQVMLSAKPFKTLDDVPSDYEEPDAYLNEAAAITLDLAKFRKG
ncbi:carboxy terminal-processing peptidase [Candidatus Enterovibrio altilux]|uniref:Tail-specific protease n=1 Tax=Candidatus Enterovibrio altilux TaxID=1927128 RepID=A0A291B6N2_9GAMM|nr:carboxy terminal-processing peptidase [Candidatus Enterovibrio luxaltus]ATF08646.1 Tail-specific protease precursor [Candidatus Enterovibrio luxaltus]